MYENDINILTNALSLYEDKYDTITDDLFEELLELKEKAECYDRIKDIIHNSNGDVELTLVKVKNKINYTESLFLEDLGDGVF